MSLKNLYTKTAQVVTKCIAYPIAGNLTERLTEKIENAVGEDWFNANSAQMTSIATNPFVYGAIAYAAFRSAGMNFMDAGLLAGVGIAMPFGLTESCVRIQCGGSSLPGKIVSVPLEILTDEEVSK